MWKKEWMTVGMVAKELAALYDETTNVTGAINPSKYSKKLYNNYLIYTLLI